MSPKIATAARLPFQEAIEFLRRKTSIPTERWTDIWQAQHAAAFVVAGAVKDALLADLRQSVESALDNGETLEDFRKSFDEAVAKHGWAHTGGRNWRSRVIFETNLRTAYAAGRYEQLKAVEKSRPFWRYTHGGSKKPRPEHLAWDGLILRADDPWWQTHYPPNGWGCSCKVFAVSERELRRRGIDPDKLTDGQCVRIGADGKAALGAIPFKGETYEWTSKDGTRQETLPRGVQPGWAYNVGEAGATERQRENRIRGRMENAFAPTPTGVKETRHREAQQQIGENIAREVGTVALQSGEEFQLSGVIREVARKIPLKKLGFTDKDATPDNATIPWAAVDAVNERLEAGGYTARVKAIVYGRDKILRRGSVVVRAYDESRDVEKKKVFDGLQRAESLGDTTLNAVHILETLKESQPGRRVSSVVSRKVADTALKLAKTESATRYIGTDGRCYVEVAIEGLEGKTLFRAELDRADTKKIHWYPVTGVGVFVLNEAERAAALMLNEKMDNSSQVLTDQDIEGIVSTASKAEGLEPNALRRKLNQMLALLIRR